MPLLKVIILSKSNMPRKQTLTEEEKKANRAAYMHAYYLKKKEAMPEHRSIKINCDICFGQYTPPHKAHHLKSARHLKAVHYRECQDLKE